MWQAKESADKFIFQYDEKYQIITSFQEILLQMTEEKYSEAISLIQNNMDVFFKDHESAIFFFYNIAQFARFNFRNFELILDVCIHFANEMKKVQTTENELIRICDLLFPNGIYYFYKKGFFTIEAIVNQSISDIFIFIYFLPEIEQYDAEYAKLREKKLFPDENDKQMKNLISLYKDVKSNPEKHIINRELNYNPSKLHKSIRDDDITAFQSILSLNNYSINHRIDFSYYERVMTHDLTNSLIQIAALYGSETIFKFLWMKNDIILDHNLLKYAFCGNNLNIIHICEQKCSLKQVYTEPIATQKFDLLDYYIENYGDQIEEYNDDVQRILKDFNFDGFYSVLNYDALLMAVYTFNYTIIKECLPKIIFIAKYVEFNDKFYNSNTSFICKSLYNFEMFKFFLEQKDPDIIICESMVNALIISLYACTNDAFKYLYSKIKSNIDISSIFEKAIRANSDIASFLLENEIEKESDDSSGSNLKYEYLDCFSPDDNIFLRAIDYYNEDVFFKLVKLFDSKFLEMKISIIAELKSSISDKMISSLFNRLSTIFEKAEMDSLKEIYSEIH